MILQPEHARLSRVLSWLVVPMRTPVVRRFLVLGGLTVLGWFISTSAHLAYADCAAASTTETASTQLTGNGQCSGHAEVDRCTGDTGCAQVPPPADEPSDTSDGLVARLDGVVGAVGGLVGQSTDDEPPPVASNRQPDRSLPLAAGDADAPGESRWRERDEAASGDEVPDASESRKLRTSGIHGDSHQSAEIADNDVKVSSDTGVSGRIATTSPASLCGLVTSHCTTVDSSEGTVPSKGEQLSHDSTPAPSLPKGPVTLPEHAVTASSATSNSMGQSSCGGGLAAYTAPAFPVAASSCVPVMGMPPEGFRDPADEPSYSPD